MKIRFDVKIKSSAIVPKGMEETIRNKYSDELRAETIEEMKDCVKGDFQLAYGVDVEDVEVEVVVEE
jgi:hypothetical protein